MGGATAQTIFEGEEIMPLQAAVMLYSDGRSAYATAHNVTTSATGIPVLLEGHPLTIDILNQMTAALAKGAESQRSFSGYLPENVLATGIGSVVWWLPASNRLVSFSCKDKIIGTASGITPHPSLVFAVSSTSWSVFAVKGNNRPKPETKLWQAPYFNTYTSGHICQGTTRVPNGATKEQIDGWSKAFFASNFSHPNVHERGKLVRYAGGPSQFWRDMLDGKFAKFPLRVLVPTEHTLDDLVTSTLNGRNLK